MESTYVLTVRVDVDKVREMSGIDNVEEAIRNEAGWMADSGIYVKSIEKTPDPDTKTTWMEMRSLKQGDTFFVNGEMYTASTNSHLSTDPDCDEYIVYDENGEGWFESDFPG